MHFTQLRSFQAVALEGSFTGAAKRLKLSQPTITRQVGELEARYGVELFHRRGRKVELSPLGRELLLVSERMFTTSEEAVELLEAANALKAGHLRIFAGDPFEVVRMIDAFAARYPGITASLTITSSDEALASLLEYRSDVAIIAGDAPHPRVHNIALPARPLILLVGKTHPWANRRAVGLKDLDGQSMIVREVGSRTRSVFEHGCAEHGVAPRIRLEIDSRDAFREAVALGLGIGVIAKQALVPDGRLHPLRIRDAELSIRRWLACLPARRNLRLIRSFLDIARSVIAPYG